MVIKRLLIADATGLFGKSVAKQLNNELAVKICDNGDRALELIRKFDPDILLIDLQLPGTDGLSVIRALRSAGHNTKVVAVTGLADGYICAELSRLQVTNVYLKPCLLGAVVSCIRDIAIQTENLLQGDWCVENEIDHILLSLNFQMGRGRYVLVHSAVTYMYHHANCFMTKTLYPLLAKQHNGSVSQVEKAIRDGIKDAWKNGNKQMWNLLFQPGLTEEGNSCPSNEVFLARIVNILVQKQRLKRPLDDTDERAM